MMTGLLAAVVPSMAAAAFLEVTFTGTIPVSEEPGGVHQSLSGRLLRKRVLICRLSQSVKPERVCIQPLKLPGRNFLNWI